MGETNTGTEKKLSRKQKQKKRRKENETGIPARACAKQRRSRTRVCGFHKCPSHGSHVSGSARVALLTREPSPGRGACWVHALSTHVSNTERAEPGWGRVWGTHTRVPGHRLTRAGAQHGLHACITCPGPGAHVPQLARGPVVTRGFHRCRSGAQTRVARPTRVGTHMYVSGFLAGRHGRRGRARVSTLSR